MTIGFSGTRSSPRKMRMAFGARANQVLAWNRQAARAMTWNRMAMGLQGFQPAVECLLTLYQPQQTPHQHDGVDGDEDAGAFADHVTGVEGILQPPVFFISRT